MKAFAVECAPYNIRANTVSPGPADTQQSVDLAGEHGTTLSKSVGMALYDLTAATRIYYRALEKGIGTEVSMG